MDARIVVALAVSLITFAPSCSTGGGRRTTGDGGGDDAFVSNVDAASGDDGGSVDDGGSSDDAWIDPNDDAGPDDAWIPPTPDAGPGHGSSLTILPADHVFMLGAGAVGTQDYTVLDGLGADVTSISTLSIDQPALATFSGATLTTSSTRGGVARISAVLGSLSATTSVEVDRTVDAVVQPGAPAGAPTLFGGSTTGPAITWVYPDDGVITPPNLPSFEVHFLPGAGQTLFDLAFVGSSTVHVYAPCSSVGGGCVITLDSLTFTEAAIAARASGTVTMTIRGTSSTGGVVGTSPPRTLGITPDPLRGGIYFWSASAGSIMRYDFDRVGASPETYIRGNTIACVGCHALSRDGTRISVGHGIPGPASTGVQDVATLSTIGARFGSNFASFSPDDSRLISSNGSHLTVIDATSGTSTGELPAGVVGSMPDWSPDGAHVVFSRPASAAPGPSTGNMGQADLMLLPWSGSAFGSATTLLASTGEDNYYPSYSPDGAWVVFNRSPSDSYNNIQAHLWAIRGDGSGGAVALTAADGAGDVGNSWPKWAPFAQTYLGEPLYWVTVSSRRDYGLRIQQPSDRTMGTVQIWMAAFRPNHAPSDPTAPSFWLPVQSTSTGNHIAQWTQVVVRQGCETDANCRTGDRCLQAMCVGPPQ
jgi:hypothetical protein